MGLRPLGAGLEDHHGSAHEPHLLETHLERIELLRHRIRNARPASLPLVGEPRRPPVYAATLRRPARLGGGVRKVSAPDSVHFVADVIDAAIELVAGKRASGRGENVRLALIRRALHLVFLGPGKHGRNKPFVGLLQILAFGPAFKVAFLILIEKAGIFADVIAKIQVAPSLFKTLRFLAALVSVDRHNADAILLRPIIPRPEIVRHDAARLAPLHIEITQAVGHHFVALLDAVAVSGDADDNLPFRTFGRRAESTRRNHRHDYRRSRIKSLSHC